MSKLKTSLIYQSVYQICAICIPLVTSPYLSRVIGAEGLGVFSFYNSLLNYFLLFAMLGIAAYGMRSIASCITKEERTHTFFSIYFLQLISSTIVLAIYILFVLCSEMEYKNILWVQVIYLASTAFDISWLFFGIEQYKTTVLRNTVVKILTVVAIFLFVKKPEDTVIYVLILSLGMLIGNLILWAEAHKYIFTPDRSKINLRIHVKPVFVLFIPVLAASIYHYMDKTLLGIFADEKSGGYYYNADKLLNIPLTLIGACCNVFMSRTSNLIAQKDYEEVERVRAKSMQLSLFLISAIALGIAGVADKFIPMFFGAGFEPCILLTKFFAAIVIIKTISTNIRSVYLIPDKMDSVYARSIALGAVVNLGVNCVLLIGLRLGALGATIATLTAELSVAVMQVLLMPNKGSCLKHICRNGKYIVCGLLMFAIVLFIGNDIENAFISLLLKIGVGAAVYLVGCFLLECTNKTDNNSLINSIRSVIRKK